MTATTTITEIDGLWVRIQKFKCRRSTRGCVMLTRLLGASVLELLASKKFEALPEDRKISALGQLFAVSNRTGGQATDPDVFEAGVEELLGYTGDKLGQGVSFSQTKLDPDGPGWQAYRGMDTLDGYDRADYQTTLALLWETIKLNYRPTSAGSGTDAGTAPAEPTSTSAAPTSSGASSSPASTATAEGGSPQRQIRTARGSTGA